MTLMNVFWFIGGVCMGKLLGEMLAVVAFARGGYERKKTNDIESR